MTPAPPATNTRITLTLSSSCTGCRHQDETARQLVTSETAPGTSDASEHHRTERETHSSISALLWLPPRGFSGVVVHVKVSMTIGVNGRSGPGSPTRATHRGFSGTADPNACRKPT